MQGEPAHCENRIVARGGSDGRSLCHDLFQADVEIRLASVALTHYGSFAFRGLEVSIGPWGPESVVGQAGGHKQKPCQEDGGKCYSVDHPVTDARDDFEERTFSS